MNIGRNDLCYCGSGKKYKNCCMNKENTDETKTIEFIDKLVARAEWYLKREEPKKAYSLLRIAWFEVQDICKAYDVKSIKEYDERFPGYDCLLNWIQHYEELLDSSNEKSKMYDRIELCEKAEELFTLNLYWKEVFIRAKANSYFRIGKEQEAHKIIEDYLIEMPDWGFGYIEMSDWYNDDYLCPEQYDLGKAKDILLRAEKVKNIRDIEVIYERLEDIYSQLGDKEMARKYNEKWKEYVNKRKK